MISDIYDADVADVQEYIDKLYNEHFASHFSIIDELYSRLKSKQHPITDRELEDVLTLVPLDMFTVSEELAKTRVALETTKLKNKETKERLAKELTEGCEAGGVSASATKEYVSRVLPVEMIPYELMVQVYTCLIDMVSAKVQFAKELIMSSKKIWDSRRSTEQSMPVSEGATNRELPRYSIPGTYVK